MAIDLRHLNHSVFGDVSLRAEVLGLFVDQATRFLRAFEPGLEDETWRHLAHTLKGSSRGVGAFALGDLLAEAEALCGAMPDKTAARAALLKRLSDAGEAAIAEAERLSEAA